MDEQQRKRMFRDTFNTVATGYDRSALRFFPISAACMAEHAALAGDESLLDVATGTGNAALHFAQALPAGQVLGVDFATGMLEQAETRARAAELNNVSFQEMDMQNLDLPDNHFDVVSCAFGIFFVEDMVTQARHLASKLRPGGKLVFSGFYDTSFQPIVDRFFARIEAYGLEIPPLSWKRVGNETLCHNLLSEAGCEQIRIERRNIGYYLKDATEWWDIVWYAGFRGLVAQLSEEALARFKAEHLAEVDALAGEEGIWLDVETLYYSGLRPA